MFKKNTSVTYFPIGRFINATTGAEVTTGTPTGAYTKDGTEGTLSGTIAYKSTAKEWGITGLTATEMNGDVIGLNFDLASCLPLHFTIKTATKLVSELNDVAATAIVSSGAITTSGGAVSTVTTTTTATNVTTVNGLAANVITAAAIASGALTAAKFAAGAFDAVWSVAARLLTAGTNIVLAKGTGITGFNDLSAAAVNTEVDTALADVGLTTTITGRIDAAITTRLAPTVAGRTLDVTATGEAGIDWANIGGATTTVNLSGTTVGLVTTTTTATTATNLTNLPAAPTDWLSAAAVSAGAATKIEDAVWAGAPVGPTLGDFKAQMVEALATDTYAEVTGVPAVPASLMAMIRHLFKLSRNKSNTTASGIAIRNDGDTADSATTTHSESAGTYTRDKWS